MSDYVKDLEIDKNALDWEWQRQSGLFLKYAEEAANANWLRDQAKENIEVIKSEVYKEVLEDPETFGVSKTTGDAIKAAIATDPRVQEVTQNYLKLKNEAEIFNSAKQAFEHKKSALEHLAKLYLSGYWSSPRITEDAKKEVVKEKSNVVRKKLNTNKRLKNRSK